MKILLTGMTAPHTTLRANNRALSFAGQIVETLVAGGLDTKSDLVWTEPSVEHDKTYYDQFDLVIVGLSPITALGATRAYGALSVINHLYDDPKLRLFVDAPNPAQITHSLNAIVKTPDNMLKPFYQNRQEYQRTNDPEIRLHVYTAIYKLATQPWPDTFYPRLPWDQENLALQLPITAGDHFTAVNLDSVSLRHERELSLPVESKWVADDLGSKWTGLVANTLAYPVVNMKRNRFSTDSEVDVEMATAAGVLISPTKKGRTWWTYRVPQALRLGVPVLTEWRDSGSLGPEWSMLASQVEHMSDARRAELAQKQLLSYSTAIGNVQHAVSELMNALGIKEKL
jgi:hypothetical protein